MSVLFRPNYRPKTPWRVTIIHNGHRREGCYATEDEANRAMRYWEQRLTAEFGVNYKKCSVEGCEDRAKGKGMCNRHYLKWKKWGDPLYVSNKEEKEAKEKPIIAPCGGVMKGTPGPRRCKLHLHCPVDKYEKCLMLAVNHNWIGWVVG